MKIPPPETERTLIETGVYQTGSVLLFDQSSGFKGQLEKTVGKLKEKTRETLLIAENRTILVQRTLRSGQIIHYPGNVIVMGDVNPGAEVVAGENIIVLGSLRGMAHAGAGGNEQALILAFRLQPTQLRIAGHITRPPDGEKSVPEEAEIALIREGIVVIERYPFIKG
jgi:septum site-determining protein MinC